MMTITEKAKQPLSVTEIVREKLAQHSKESAALWIEIGDLLIEEEKAVKDQGGSFKDLFADNAAERQDIARFPFSNSQGSKLKKIAAAFSHWEKTECLPPSWQTLYILTEAKQIGKLIADGMVHPMMTRAEATTLVKPEGKSKTIDAAIRRFTSAKKWLQELPEGQRAEQLLLLMGICGITVEQLQKEAGGAS